jgi:hypothetical protein
MLYNFGDHRGFRVSGNVLFSVTVWRTEGLTWTGTESVKVDRVCFTIVGKR